MRRRKKIKIFEKRKHVRFPVMQDMAKPILIRYDGEIESMPAFLIDLSANGIGILTFKRLKPKMKLEITLDLPGLKIRDIQAEVTHVKQRNETFYCGIKFLSLPRSFVKKINNIAKDYAACEERISLDLTNVCQKRCHYYSLCDKREKR